MNALYQQIKSVIEHSSCGQTVSDFWLQRLDAGELTRDECKESHFCVYFLPYDSATRTVLLVHHKKAGLWLSPGGHIDLGESLIQTLNREIAEELGVSGKTSAEIEPFLLTVTPIDNSNQACKEHLDIWYRFETDPSELRVDLTEFHETGWVTLGEARQMITDPPNLKAIDRMEQFFATLVNTP